VHLALWDELTQFTRAQYTYIRSRLRVAGPAAVRMAELGWVPRMISSSNPTGPGHDWVKRMFVDPSPGPDIVFEGGIAEGEDPAGLRTMAYIPALATDNPHLDQPAYARELAGLDPILRRALQFGDWDVLLGVRFSQFRRNLHVIEPDMVDVPLLGYPRGCGVDWGIAAPFCALWGVLLPGPTLYVYRELYGPNLTAQQQARLIRESEEPEERSQYRPLPIVLDPSCWIRSPSEPVVKNPNPNAPARGSIAWWYTQEFGGAVSKANNDRIGGWQLIDQGLLMQDNGLPGILISTMCPNLIRTLPAMLRSKTNPNDVATVPKQDDHAVDALRYLAQLMIGGGITRLPPESPAVGEEQEEREAVDRRYDALLGADHRRRLEAARGGGVLVGGRRQEVDS